jgi:MFS family permease
MDRRLLILASAAGGLLASLIGLVFGSVFEALLVAAFLLGGFSNPLYALLIAYMNDYLDQEDMAAASGGLLFVNGLGAIIGPLLTGWAMSQMGAPGFWAYLLGVMILLAGYVVYRMTQRASLYAGDDDYDAVAYAPISPSATPVAVELAQEFYAENADTLEEQVGGESESPLDRS